jgi:hypothetical protein
MTHVVPRPAGPGPSLSAPPPSCRVRRGQSPVPMGDAGPLGPSAQRLAHGRIPPVPCPGGALAQQRATKSWPPKYPRPSRPTWQPRWGGVRMGSRFTRFTMRPKIYGDWSLQWGVFKGRIYGRVESFYGIGVVGGTEIQQRCRLEWSHFLGLGVGLGAEVRQLCKLGRL